MRNQDDNIINRKLIKHSPNGKIKLPRRMTKKEIDPFMRHSRCTIAFLHVSKITWLGRLMDF